MKRLLIVLALYVLVCPTFVAAQAQFVDKGVGRWTFAWYDTDEEGFFTLTTTPDFSHEQHPISFTLVGIKRKGSDSFEYQWGISDMNNRDTDGELELSFALDGKGFGASSFRGVGNFLYVHRLFEEPFEEIPVPFIRYSDL